MLLIQIGAVILAAYLLARLTAWIRLPALLGMIVAGALVGNLLLHHLPTPTLGLKQVSPYARQAVLAIILLRAGLGISLADVRQSGGLALSLGLIPMLGDTALVTVGGVLLLDLPLPAALALGFLVAAISPAIVIPGMLRLLEKRSGDNRRVPTALLAGAPLDNIAAVVGFGIALDIALAAGSSWTQTLARAPFSIGMGVLLGAAVGLPLSLVLSRVRSMWLATGLLWLLACGLIPACHLLHGSFVLAILVLGAVVRARAPSLESLELLSWGTSKLWSVARFVLFGLIGAAVDFAPLATIGLAALVVILLGQLGRAAATLLATLPFHLRLRERVACVCAYLPKATIQAAFAAVALDRGLAQGQTLLSTAVLAVAIMAPIGVVALHRGTDRLLP